jgi:rod shape-determining protein MreC
MSRIDAAKGSIKQTLDGWQEYFGLRGKNEELLNANLKLAEENANLHTRLDAIATSDTVGNLSPDRRKFKYIPADVVEIQLNRGNNKIILDAGSRQNVSRNMGVISVDGIVGIVDRVSDNYCVVTSLLNPEKNINGKLRKSGLYGPLVWNKRDIRYTEMIDIPHHVTIEKGDSVVTSGHSLTFPEGLFIGVVDTFYLDKGTSNRVRVKLGNDFQSLKQVYIINATNKHELDSLKMLVN